MRILTYAKFITLLLIFAFIMFAFNFYREDITVENFRYMIKYLDFEAPDSSASISDSSISFNGESAVETVVYRNDIALLRRTGLDMYDLNGQMIFTSPYTMTSPTAACGNKYMLVFDVGGTYAAIFNTFSKIWEETFEYPIIDAAINDNGDFCIATSEMGYTSAVYVYNSNFQRIYRWLSGDKYVMDIAMSKDKSDRFMLSTLRAQNGFYMNEMLLLSTNSDERIASYVLYDQMVMEVSPFFGTATLLTDKTMTFLNSETLEKIGSVSFSADELQDFAHNDKYSILVLSKKSIDSENQILVYGSDGTYINTFTSSGHIIDICLSDDKLYQLTSGEVKIYDLSSFESETVTADKRYDRLLSGQSAVILASATDAVAIKGEYNR